MRALSQHNTGWMLALSQHNTGAYLRYINNAKKATMIKATVNVLQWQQQQMCASTRCAWINCFERHRKHQQTQNKGAPCLTSYACRGVKMGWLFTPPVYATFLRHLLTPRWRVAYMRVTYALYATLICPHYQHIYICGRASTWRTIGWRNPQNARIYILAWRFIEPLGQNKNTS